MEIIKNIGKALTLEPLKGMRTQITAIIGFALNMLVASGILKWTPEELNQVNTTLAFVIGYFFVEKVSK